MKKMGRLIEFNAGDLKLEAMIQGDNRFELMEDAIIRCAETGIHLLDSDAEKLAEGIIEGYIAMGIAYEYIKTSGREFMLH